MTFVGNSDVKEKIFSYLVNPWQLSKVSRAFRNDIKKIAYDGIFAGKWYKEKTENEKNMILNKAHLYDPEKCSLNLRNFLKVLKSLKPFKDIPYQGGVKIERFSYVKTLDDLRIQEGMNIAYIERGFSPFILTIPECIFSITRSLTSHYFVALSMEFSPDEKNPYKRGILSLYEEIHRHLAEKKSRIGEVDFVDFKKSQDAIHLSSFCIPDVFVGGVKLESPGEIEDVCLEGTVVISFNRIMVSGQGHSTLFPTVESVSVTSF